MNLHFYKYQGTGNDFIIADHRIPLEVNWSQELVAKLCCRRTGIGADGLMLLEDEKGYDFKMRYFNSDGKPGSMCGNGGRCLAAFAKRLGIGGNKLSFIAVDGPHEAEIRNDGLVSLKMANVQEIECGTDYFFLNTGSPHYVKLVDNPSDLDLIKEAHAVRYSERFSLKGTNVNFVKTAGNTVEMRTYERGVEDETWSCGTGVTAAALCADQLSDLPLKEVFVKTKGGSLSVRFHRQESGYSDIWLTGPAQFVFQGSIDV